MAAIQILPRFTKQDCLNRTRELDDLLFLNGPVGFYSLSSWYYMGESFSIAKTLWRQDGNSVSKKWRKVLWSVPVFVLGCLTG